MLFDLYTGRKVCFDGCSPLPITLVLLMYTLGETFVLMAVVHCYLIYTLRGKFVLMAVVHCLLVLLIYTLGEKFVFMAVVTAKCYLIYTLGGKVCFDGCGPLPISITDY